MCIIGTRIALCWLALLGPTALARPEDLLTEVRRANRSTLESIDTFTCRVAVTTNAAGSIDTVVGTYARSGSKVRLKWRQGASSPIDVMVQDSKLFTYQVIPRSDGRESRVGNVTPHDGSPLGLCDVWFMALMNQTAPGCPYLLPLDALLDRCPKVRAQAEHISENGRAVIRVTLTGDSSKSTYDFDPSVNYLVRKRTIDWMSSGTMPQPMTTESEVVSFVEVSRGLYFPAQVRTRQSSEGRVTGTEDATFTEMRVNEAMQSAAMNFQFPAGTVVRDEIEAKEYGISASGAIINARPLPEAAPLTTADGLSRTETREEALPWTSWILPTSGTLLIVGCVLWLLRAWRRRGESVE